MHVTRSYERCTRVYESLREIGQKNFGRGTAGEQLPATTDRIGCSMGERSELGSDLEAG